MVLGSQDETFHSEYEHIIHSYSCQSHQKFLSLGEKLNDDCSQENIVRDVLLLKRNKAAFLKDLILQFKINGGPQSKGKW